MNPLLFAQTLCWDLTAPFLSFGLRIALIVAAFSHPTLIVTTIVSSWIILMFIRNIFVPLRAGRKLPGLLLYIFYSELCLYWLNLWALFTMKNRSWSADPRRRRYSESAPGTSECIWQEDHERWVGLSRELGRSAYGCGHRPVVG